MNPQNYATLGYPPKRWAMSVLAVYDYVCMFTHSLMLQTRFVYYWLMCLNIPRVTVRRWCVCVPLSVLCLVRVCLVVAVVL